MCIVYSSRIDWCKNCNLDPVRTTIIQNRYVQWVTTCKKCKIEKSKSDFLKTWIFLNLEAIVKTQLYL